MAVLVHVVSSLTDTYTISPAPSVRMDQWAVVLATVLTMAVAVVSEVRPSWSLPPPVGTTPRMSRTPTVMLLETIAMGPAVPGKSMDPVAPRKATSIGSAGLATLSRPVTKTRPPPITYEVRFAKSAASVTAAPAPVPS